MLSGLERQQMALGRQRRVTWAWVKARDIMCRQAAPKDTKLTKSVLATGNGADPNAASWRENLAAVIHRKLARQICEHFYNLSVINAWRGRTPEAVATSRMLSPALPSYCRDSVSARAERSSAQPREQARIMSSVLQGRTDKGGAVLISLKSRAA